MVRLATIRSLAVGRLEENSGSQQLVTLLCASSGPLVCGNSTLKQRGRKQAIMEEFENKLITSLLL